MNVAIKGNFNRWAPYYSSFKLLSMATSPPKVMHNVEEKEFYLSHENGDKAYLQYKMIDHSTMDLEHTIVPSTMQGKGIGKILAEAAFSYAKEKDMKVQITCDFVQKFASKQLRPEWKILLKDS